MLYICSRQQTPVFKPYKGYSSPSPSRVHTPSTCILKSVLAPSSVLWPFLNKVIWFFDISLWWFWNFIWNENLIAAINNIPGPKSSLSNYKPRNPTDCFWALRNFSTWPMMDRKAHFFRPFLNMVRRVWLSVKDIFLFLGIYIMLRSKICLSCKIEGGILHGRR